jgi:1,4-alpha-glucan branching enzyme
MEITHEDYSNNIIAFRRWNNEGDIILIVVNAGDNSFTDHAYGLSTRQIGQWQQILCSQDREFGGWQGAGNAYYDPYNQDDKRIYINIPKWSVLIFKSI